VVDTQLKRIVGTVLARVPNRVDTQHGRKRAKRLWHVTLQVARFRVMSVVTDVECYEHVKVCFFGMLPGASRRYNHGKAGSADCMAN
jgi:hypothetical protein